MNDATLRTVSGVVVRGDGRGRLLGFPTANLALHRESLPAAGIYAAWARINDDSRLWASSVSVGVNPTFIGDRERRVEVHLHDADVNLYGMNLSVELVEHLRPMYRFDGVEALIAQTADDVARCRVLLGRGEAD